MALNFPNNPSNGDIWVDPSNGSQYLYASATKSWLVTGINVGGGTVSSVNVSGTNGIETSGGPIVDIGTITIDLNIDGRELLP